MSEPKLMAGYAETSTKRRPKEPTTVVVSQEACDKARFVGEAVIDGRVGWQCWRVGRRFYFQYRPW